MASRNESTKRIFWKLHHKTNPRNESFERRRMKRIHENESFENQRIRKSESKGFGRIHLSYSTKDLWGFVGFVGFVKYFENGVTKWIREMNLLKMASRNESAKRIFWKWRHKTNPQNESFENWQIKSKRIRKTNLLKTDKSNWNESMDLQNESTFLQISYTIPASL